MKVVELQTPKQGADVEFLAQLHHEEFGGSREFDVDAVMKACVNCALDIQRDQVNCWIAYNTENQPIGYLAATIHSSFYSFRKYAIQEMWFVIPRYRNARAAVALLTAYERWATQRNVERIYTQVEHDDNVEVVERIFQFMNMLGYRKQGYIAVKQTHIKLEDKADDPGTHRKLGAQ
jgi:hypothetical protein